MLCACGKALCQLACAVLLDSGIFLSPTGWSCGGGGGGGGGGVAAAAAAAGLPDTDLYLKLCCPGCLPPAGWSCPGVLLDSLIPISIILELG